jgi:hypothetical protein
MFFTPARGCYNFSGKEGETFLLSDVRGIGHYSTLWENHQGRKNPFFVTFTAPGQRRFKMSGELMGVFYLLLV